MKQILAGIGVFSLLIIWACHLNQEGGDLTLNVEGDASWTEFERLIIEVRDTSGRVVDTIYDDRLASTDGLKGLPAGRYTGGAAVFTISGYQDGDLVFEQTRAYDGATGKAVVETTLSVSAQVESMSAKPDSLILYLGGGSFPVQIQTTPKYARPPLLWKLEGDAASIDAGTGAYAATLRPKHAGEAELRVQTKSGSFPALILPVRVVVDTPALEVSPARAYIEPGKDVQFTVTARQAYGDVVSLECDLDGDGSYEDSATGKWEGKETRLPVRKRTYGQAGSYPVKFRVKDSEGNVSIASATVVAGERKPSVTLFPKDTVISIKDEVRFRASILEPDGKVESYAWDWNGDGESEDVATLSNSGAELKVSRTFSDSGEVTVILSAKDADGKEGSDTAVVTVVKDVPVPDPGAAITAKSRAPVIFAGKAEQRFGAIVEYKWDFDGNGTYDEASETPPAMTHAYPMEGVYNAVFYVRDDDGNVATAVRKVTISDAPIIIAAKRADTTISIKDAISMTATIRNEDGKPLNYAWDYDADGKYDDSASSGDKEILFAKLHAYPQEGKFKATLRVRDEQGKTLTDTVVVTVLLDPPKAELGKDDTVLIGESVPVSLKETANRFGAIEKRELRINGDSAWIPLSKQDTTLLMPQTKGTVRVIGRVTDEDGLVGLDTLDIVVRFPAENRLSGIFLSAGTLTPAFAADSVKYAAAFAYNAASVVVGAAARDPKSSITVNGTALTASVTSVTISLKPGANQVPIVVTAQDTAAKRTYTITLNRALSPVSTLSNLVPSSDSLNPKFLAGTTAYTLPVSDIVDTLRFTPTVADTQARVTVAGASVPSGTLSQKIPIPLGTTKVDIVVTAGTGAKTTYSVSVIRKGWSLVGAPAFSKAKQALQSFSADKGIACAALLDSTGFKASAWSWDGTAWTDIAAGKISDTAVSSLAVDMNAGTPWLAVMSRPGAGIGFNITMRKYAAGAWALAGKTLGSGYSAYEYSLDHNGANVPYLAYRHSYIQNQHFVYKFADTAWNTLAQSGALDSVYNLRMAVNRMNGQPVVAYTRLAPGGVYKAYVTAHTGTQYVPVGTLGWSVANARIDLAIDALGYSYYAYIDPTTGQAAVRKYSGSWNSLGPVTGFSDGKASSICVAMAGDTPVVAYRDAKLATVVVKHWNGSAWIDFGTADFAIGDADIVRLAVDETGVWVAYSQPGEGKVSVMRRPLP